MQGAGIGHGTWSEPRRRSDGPVGMRRGSLLPLALLSAALCAAACQQGVRGGSALWGTLPRGTHGVGFKRVVLEDGSRAVPVPGEAAGSDSHRSRPVILYLWYPTRGGLRPGSPFDTYVRMAGADVGRRTSEVGIRMALGARAGDVVSTVVRQGMTPVMVGVLLGLGGLSP